MLLPLLALLLASPADDPQWGGFRGANGCGRSAGPAVPSTLDVETNALWRTEFPSGYSSPVVAGDLLFATGADGEELVTACLDRHTGEVLWRRALEFDGERPGANSPAAPTPATDGARVVALFHAFGLVCYDAEGEELWRRELAPFSIPHGMSSSPVLHEGLVIQLVDQNVGSYLLALDAASGEERWRVERPGAAHGYSTPAIHVPAEGPAQVLVSGSYRLTAYSIADGAELWWLDGAAWQTKAVPVLAGELCLVNAYMPPSSEFGLPRLSKSFEEMLAELDGDGNGELSREEWENPVLAQVWFLFDRDGNGDLSAAEYEYLGSAASATGALFAVRLGGAGDVSESHLAWSYDDRRGLPDASSPLYLDGLLYLVKDGVLTALDAASGEVVKQGRVGEPSPHFASPVAAGGRIVLAGTSGQLAVVKAGREWEVLSTSQIGEEVWATPAIADGTVYVRSTEALYAFRDA